MHRMSQRTTVQLHVSRHWEAPGLAGAYHAVVERRLAMPDLVAELAEKARTLAPEDRSRLVDLLLESLHESPLAEV